MFNKTGNSFTKTLSVDQVGNKSPCADENMYKYKAYRYCTPAALPASAAYLLVRDASASIQLVRLEHPYRSCQAYTDTEI